MAHPEEPTLPEDTGQRKNKNMEELMKMIVRRTALAVCTLVLAVTLSTAASAACTGFDDVSESADCYESVIYLAKCEIAAGTGNDCFSPEQLITVEQWAVMLCRAYGVETIGDNWQDVGRSSVVEAYRQGWLNETALSAPNIQLRFTGVRTRNAREKPVQRPTSFRLMKKTVGSSTFGASSSRRTSLSPSQNRSKSHSSLTLRAMSKSLHSMLSMQ